MPYIFGHNGACCQSGRNSVPARCRRAGRRCWSSHASRRTRPGTCTGQAYDNTYCAVFCVRDGQITEVREYLDSLHAAQVLFGSAG
jgi:hypothetical protein